LGSARFDHGNGQVTLGQYVLGFDVLAPDDTS